MEKKAHCPYLRVPSMGGPPEGLRRRKKKLTVAGSTNMFAGMTIPAQVDDVGCFRCEKTV